MDSTKNRMDAIERWNALINKQPLDRVPFSTLGNPIFCCKNVGYTVSDAYSDARKCFEAQLWTAEQYDYFPLTYYSPGGFYGALEFGGEVRMPLSEYDMAPTVVKYPIGSEEEVYKIKLPDVKTSGCLPVNMEFSKLQEAVPDIPIVVTAHTVLTIAGNLVSVEQLCKWMMRKPELVHYLVNLSTSHYVEVAEYWVNTFGPERIIFYSAAATESNQMISPKQFEEFFLPYQLEAHKKLLDMGIRHIYIHICGDQRLNLKFWRQIPMGDPGLISFGPEIDLEMAAAYFPNDIIVGNVSPVILYMDRGEKVYEISRACIETGKKYAAGRFMLAAGCFIPAETPSHNYWIMQKALNDFGWYESKLH